MKGNGKHTSMLDKGLEIINLIVREKKPLKITEISEMLAIPRTTVYRLIKSLESCGFVRQTGSSTRYFLSLQFLYIAEIVRESLDLRRVALPFMERLRDDLDLAVHLVIRDGNEAVYLEKVDSRRPVRLFTQVGRRAPLHVTACPRILLAYCSDDEIRRYISTVKMVKYTKNTVADPDTLWAKIHEIRRTGFSIAYGELEPETAAIAVPIRNDKGKVVASLSLAGPEWHFKSEDIDYIVSKLRDCAQRISQELGYNPG